MTDLPEVGACTAANRDGMPCWLLAGHWPPQPHEVHPSSADRTGQPHWTGDGRQVQPPGPASWPPPAEQR